MKMRGKNRDIIFVHFPRWSYFRRGQCRGAGPICGIGIGARRLAYLSPRCIFSRFKQEFGSELWESQLIGTFEISNSSPRLGSDRIGYSSRGEPYQASCVGGSRSSPCTVQALPPLSKGDLTIYIILNGGKGQARPWAIISLAAWSSPSKD
jgi:hypothetical protein